jgi:exonuclease VII large subunit
MKPTNSIDYVDKQKRELEKRQQEVRAREFAALEQRTTTRHDRIPDMKDAYAQVVAKNYKPSQQEIEFRRFTSGGFMDNAKGH